MRYMEYSNLPGRILHGNSYLWSVMKQSSVSRTRRFTYFSESVLCLGKMHQNPQSNTVWEDKLTWFKSFHITELWTQLMVSQWNSSGIFSQDSPRCSSSTKSKSSWPKWAINQKNLKDGIIFMSMYNDISWGSQDNEQECELSAQPRFYVCKKIFTRKMDLDQKRSGILLMVADHKENGTESLNWWW